MIARLRGALVHRDGTRGIIEVGGVGYEVWSTDRSLRAWSGEDEVVAWISTQVREDAITLYGFSEDLDRQAFLVLLGVKGIGPKAAIATLDTLDVPTLASAVASDDVVTLSRIPGVGKRTAQRLALELKGKLPAAFAPTDGAPHRPRGAADALPLALARLEYGKSEIDRAMRGLVAQGLGPDETLQKRLSAALRILSGNS